MKEIKLTQGQVALIDDDDFDYLNQWSWYASKHRNSFRAMRKDIGGKTIFMHRVIMNTPLDLQVDHKDHDTLNNQKFNLRNCTSSQNQQNRTSKYGSSIYRGVFWYKRDRKWAARIKVKDKYGWESRIHLGHFKNEKDAALAYNIVAIKYHGEFAYLNQIGGLNEQA